MGLGCPLLTRADVCYLVMGPLPFPRNLEPEVSFAVLMLAIPAVLSLAVAAGTRRHVGRRGSGRGFAGARQRVQGEAEARCRRPGGGPPRVQASPGTEPPDSRHSARSASSLTGPSAKHGSPLSSAAIQGWARLVQIWQHGFKADVSSSVPALILRTSRSPPGNPPLAWKSRVPHAQQNAQILILPESPRVLNVPGAGPEKATALRSTNMDSPNALADCFWQSRQWQA